MSATLEVILYVQALVIAIVVVLLLMVLTTVSPLAGYIFKLPGEVRKTLDTGETLDRAAKKLAKIEVLSGTAVTNVERLDQGIAERAEFENKIGIAQTLLGTLVGFLGAVGADWVIHGGSFFGIGEVDSEFWRGMIVLVPSLIAVVAVPLILKKLL